MLAGVLSLLALGTTASPSVDGLAFVDAYRRGGFDGLGQPRDVVVSPEGAHVYTAGGTGVTLFVRDGTTGVLTFVETQREGIGGVTELQDPRKLALSPDGNHLYVTSFLDDSLVVFARDASTGRLTFVEVEQDGVNGVDGLNAAGGVAVSPDGKHVYVAGFGDDAVAVFARDPATGAVSFVEAQRDGVGGVDGLKAAVRVTVSPDGNHAYATGRDDDAVAVFARDQNTGALTFVEVQRDGVGGVDGLHGPGGLTVSPDGKFAYVGSGLDAAVVVFARDPGTGALSFVQVNQQNVDVNTVTISPDGTTLYASGFGAEALLVYRRDTVTGALTFLEKQQDGKRGVEGLRGASSVAVSPDGRHVYSPGFFDNALVLFQALHVRCSPSPQGSCRLPMASRAARLTLRKRPGLPARTAAKWRWGHGAATTLGDFGAPLATTDYAFCVYDASGATQPVLQTLVPSDSVCDGRRNMPCWRQRPGGVRYNDGLRTPDGVQALDLRPGAAGQARIQLRAKGENLTPPTLPLVPPVRAQLQSSDGTCWEAVYGAPKKNDATVFSARSD